MLNVCVKHRRLHVGIEIAAHNDTVVDRHRIGTVGLDLQRVQMCHRVTERLVESAFRCLCRRILLSR